MELFSGQGEVAAGHPRTYQPGEALREGLKFALAAAAVIALLTWTSGRVEYNWQWYRIPRFILEWTESGLRAGPLLQGLAVTLKVTSVSLGLAFIIGLITAVLRLSSSPVGRAVARFYLETIRNTPLLIQLFFMYFVLAPILGLGAFTSAVLALSLFEGAYTSEMFRSGILAVDQGQWEAAHSLGMSRYQAYRHVVLPQAVRRILPMLTGQAVSLIKDSALVSTIAIYDLTMQGQVIIAETYLTFEIWFTVAAIYLILTVSVSGLAALMERRLTAHLAA